jgi:hypothetical protein
MTKKILFEPDGGWYNICELCKQFERGEMGKKVPCEYCVFDYTEETPDIKDILEGNKATMARVCELANGKEFTEDEIKNAKQLKGTVIGAMHINDVISKLDSA